MYKVIHIVYKDVQWYTSVEEDTELYVYLPLDGLLHGSEMDRDMRGVGHQPSVWSKQCTREVQPLLLQRGTAREVPVQAELGSTKHHKMVEAKKLSLASVVSCSH